MCDEIAGFREAMKSKAKQVADFKKICDTVSRLSRVFLRTTASILRSCCWSSRVIRY